MLAMGVDKVVLRCRIQIQGWVGAQDGRFVVKEVVPDRAADKSGRIKIGDEIVDIDGRSTKVLPPCHVTSKLLHPQTSIFQHYSIG